jgi:drug/metabolite transporter (DMT)-like permease
MAIITKFGITKANPFMISAPEVVFLIGVLFLGEIITIRKLLGLLIITFGIIITTKY